jgi:UDP-N-acetylglucosamine--N-acetylmuramyl-(pentapeptide) pyrophosphoryl-undecaprenol N-acetylglucosamine transferase
MPNAPEPGTVEAGFRLAVAGGGTGGHMFPGIAVAQTFLARHRRNQVIFINSGRPLEKKILGRLGWPQHVIDIEGIKGRGVKSQMSVMMKIPRAIRQSALVLKHYRADVVLGVGGYSAGPAVMAAWLMGIPTALHEQNQLPGLTNRLLRRIVDRIYLTFEDAAHRFKAEKTLITGNPVRDEIVALGAEPAPESGSGLNVLIVGGSQGARPINQAMVDALPHLKTTSELGLVHQTGVEDEEWVREAYGETGAPAVVQAFFNDMAAQYANADLIICRAGATTVAEITAIGKAAVFIPFPQAADDHQTLNAQVLVEEGAALMIRQDELTGERLAATIDNLMTNREQVAAMAENALSLGRPEAAVTIVNDIYHLIENRRV